MIAAFICRERSDTKSNDEILTAITSARSGGGWLIISLLGFVRQKHFKIIRIDARLKLTPERQKTVADLEACLKTPVRISNDANCFALSEAIDGAGAGYDSVFGVIIGTGCGGGIVIDQKIVGGVNGLQANGASATAMACGL